MASYIEFEFKGIKKITIPYLDSDFMDNAKALGIINKYLPQIMATHSTNATKEQFLYDYMKGRQDILDKERLYQKDSDNNNKIVENHAYRQVTFKTGFLLGDKRDYVRKITPNGESDIDDLTYLDRYLTDVNFFSKDKDLKEWIYTTGIGATYCRPRTDIIVEGLDSAGNKIVRYLDLADGYDINYEAPFEFDTVDPTNNFVVYSSSRSGEPLFSVSIAEKDIGKDGQVEIIKTLQVETKYGVFESESDELYSDITEITGVKAVKILRYIPVVEHSINNYRLGIVELNRELFNSINTLISNVSDIVVDNANRILVFKNVDIDGDDVLEMKRAGAIILPSDDGKDADLKTLDIQIDFDGFDKYYEQRVSKSYDIAGVPLASGQVSSGGDTGQARLLGGGWNNAYTVIKNDINSLLKSDYMVLKQIIMFCKQVPSCPVNNIGASEIDIKYRINQNDNFLVKAEGIQQLYACSMPLEEILKASGLFSDTDAVASKWAEREKEIKASNSQPTLTGNDSQE